MLSVSFVAAAGSPSHLEDQDEWTVFQWVASATSPLAATKFYILDLQLNWFIG